MRKYWCVILVLFLFQVSVVYGAGSFFGTSKKATDEGTSNSTKKTDGSQNDKDHKPAPGQTASSTSQGNTENKPWKTGDDAGTANGHTPQESGQHDNGNGGDGKVNSGDKDKDKKKVTPTKKPNEKPQVQTPPKPTATKPTPTPKPTIKPNPPSIFVNFPIGPRYSYPGYRYPWVYSYPGWKWWTVSWKYFGYPNYYWKTIYTFRTPWPFHYTFNVYRTVFGGSLYRTLNTWLRYHNFYARPYTGYPYPWGAVWGGLQNHWLLGNHRLPTWYSTLAGYFPRVTYNQWSGRWVDNLYPRFSFYPASWGSYFTASWWREMSYSSLFRSTLWVANRGLSVFYRPGYFNNSIYALGGLFTRGLPTFLNVVRFQPFAYRWSSVFTYGWMKYAFAHSCLALVWRPVIKTRVVVLAGNWNWKRVKVLPVRVVRRIKPVFCCSHTLNYRPFKNWKWYQARKHHVPAKPKWGWAKVVTVSKKIIPVVKIKVKRCVVVLVKRISRPCLPCVKVVRRQVVRKWAWNLALRAPVVRVKIACARFKLPFNFSRKVTFVKQPFCNWNWKKAGMLVHRHPTHMIRPVVASMNLYRVFSPIVTKICMPRQTWSFRTGGLW